ncbi:MAG: DNA ligase [Acidobacteria bacterium OLB17]|nr:MAG: DNA ligase [Acidobacteria bacterium OLB17]
MPDLGFDKKKFTCKHGYCTGKAIDLADPSLHVKAQDYKRRVSNMMRALSPEDIARIPRARNYSVSRKYDGENAMLFFDGKQMLSVNAGGTVRTGLPGFDEAVELLKKAKVASCTLAAEIYVRKGATKAHPVQQVVRVLRNPPSKEKLEDLGVAVFDVLEVDGEQVTSVVDVYRYLNKWFGKGKRVHPAEERFVEKPEDIMQAFAEWVIAEGSEGLVVRSDQAGWFKVKSRHSLDAAVIGYSEGTDERKGMLHDLLVAVIRPDGTFQEFTRVGGGFSEEDRRSFVADLKKTRRAVRLRRRK